jgi:hypothetical protein
VNYKFTPQFAAGNLFASSMLDTLVGQAYFNPKVCDGFGLFPVVVVVWW